MIKGLGIDIVELVRMKTIIQTKPNFITKVLTKNEIEIFQKLSSKRQVEFLAGRFACKEAFSKAWGTGIGSVSFQDIEILKEQKTGCTYISKSPHTGELFVSISHTEIMAVAQIVLEL